MQHELNAALLQVKIVEENLAFEVEPLHGLVPADGAVQVAIHYTPSRMATDSMQLQVSCHPAVCRHAIDRITIAPVGGCLS